MTEDTAPEQKAMTDARQHEWLWHDEESNLTSYGRWAKHPRQAKYVRKDLFDAARKVKPLVWSNLGNGPDCIGSPDHYQIWSCNGGSGAPDDPYYSYDNFGLHSPDMSFLGEFKALDDAKAAAQADYQRRILSALDQGGAG